ncbi:guanylate kinase domain-containing protein [Sarocladium implicatum]|nr:guanylate kinase domain-containing protein [Sarocladium implicatum]
MTTKAQVIAVSGPSGVGKGTLITRLLYRHPDRFVRSVSHTTRDPRPGETDTSDYHFVTSDAFRSLISQGAFVEHTIFSGNHYGTSWQAIEKRHVDSRTLVLDIEMEGVKAIKSSQNIPLRCAFITPPSLETLEARLRSRGTETEESLRERMAKAKEEMDFAVNTACSDDIIIVNDDLDTSYLELEQWALGGSR